MFNYVRVTHLWNVTMLNYLYIKQSTIGSAPKTGYIEERRSQPSCTLIPHPPSLLNRIFESPDCHSTWQLSRSLVRRHRSRFDAFPARLFRLFSNPAACKPVRWVCMISVQCYWSRSVVSEMCLRVNLWQWLNHQPFVSRQKHGYSCLSHQKSTTDAETSKNGRVHSGNWADVGGKIRKL